MQKVNALPTQAMNTTPQSKPLNTNALELKDIHVPEQISDFPIAYGWWILAIALFIIIVISIIKIRKSAKRNQIKKQALHQLKNNPEMNITDQIGLMKWAAMHYFSRAELAKFFGNSLQEFLAQQLPSKHQKNFTDLSEQAFINQYQAHGSDSGSIQTDESLYQATTLWLTQALPPKAPKNSKDNKQGDNK